MKLWTSLVFLSLVPSLASASMTDELISILKKSPTGNEVAAKLEILRSAPSISQRVEIFYPHEILASDQKQCPASGEVAAKTLPPDSELGLPIRIIFCKSGNRLYLANILAHEAVHAIDRALTPEGIRLFGYIAHFFDQYIELTPAEFERESKILDGLTDLNTLAREYKAYAIDSQVSSELLSHYPTHQGEMPLLIDPRKSARERNRLIRHNFEPDRFRSIVNAYERIQNRPDILNDLDHFIPRVDLEEMIIWMKSHQNLLIHSELNTERWE